MFQTISKYHSVLDYAIAAILVLPWIFNSYVYGMDSWVLGFIGLVTAAYSLVTNYRGSIVKVLPMKVHHIFDLLSGLLMALSPVLFTLEPSLWFLPGILGIAQIATALLPAPVHRPQHSKRFKMT